MPWCASNPQQPFHGCSDAPNLYIQTYLAPANSVLICLVGIWIGVNIMLNNMGDTSTTWPLFSTRLHWEVNVCVRCSVWHVTWHWSILRSRSIDATTWVDSCIIMNLQSVHLPVSPQCCCSLLLDLLPYWSNSISTEMSKEWHGSFFSSIRALCLLVIKASGLIMFVEKQSSVNVWDLYNLAEGLRFIRCQETLECSLNLQVLKSHVCLLLMWLTSCPFLVGLQTDLARPVRRQNLLDSWLQRTSEG